MSARGTHRTIRSRGGKAITLVGRGNVLSFEIKGGHIEELPQDFVMLHDPKNQHMRSCTLVCCRCVFKTDVPEELDTSMLSEAERYFGPDADLIYAEIDLPSGPWELVGDVAQVFYDRQGMYDDSWFHPYKNTTPPVQLFKNPDGSGYLLSLPDKCEVTERGFVYP